MVRAPVSIAALMLAALAVAGQEEDARPSIRSVTVLPAIIAALSRSIEDDFACWLISVGPPTFDESLNRAAVAYIAEGSECGQAGPVLEARGRELGIEFERELAEARPPVLESGPARRRDVPVAPSTYVLIKEVIE